MIEVIRMTNRTILNRKKSFCFSKTQNTVLIGEYKNWENIQILKIWAYTPASNQAAPKKNVTISFPATASNRIGNNPKETRLVKTFSVTISRVFL
ncbi:MAG: hypothetical protein RJR35_08095 [Thermoanaerobacterales bacterium]|nr:hypothetical protein [Thermoanaerobacterales bacterium]